MQLTELMDQTSKDFLVLLGYTERAKARRRKKCRTASGEFLDHHGQLASKLVCASERERRLMCIYVDGWMRKRKQCDVGAQLVDALASVIVCLSCLQRTTYPWYICCIKPNVIRFRPVDGVACFDSGKVLTQLLNYGVMKVFVFML